MRKGKKLEKCLKSSCEEKMIYCFRLRDTASSYYGGNDNLRFSNTNPCDFIIFNGEKLFMCECKETKGKSLPYSNIKKNQIESLTHNAMYNNVKCGFLIWFDDLEELYYMSIQEFNEYVRKSDRKSVAGADLETKIPITLKKVNFKIDVEKMFNKI